MAIPLKPGDTITVNGTVAIIVRVVEGHDSTAVYIQPAVYQHTTTNAANWTFSGTTNDASPDQFTIQELTDKPEPQPERTQITYPVRGEVLGLNVARCGRRGLVTELAQQPSTYG